MATPIRPDLLGPEAERQYYIRYWFLVYGYDEQYVDVFFFSDHEPSDGEASGIIERALAKLKLGGLAREMTHPADEPPLRRENRFTDWDSERGVMQPVILTPRGKVRVEKYRLRNANTDSEHLQSRSELLVDEKEIL